MDASGNPIILQVKNQTQRDEVTCPTSHSPSLFSQPVTLSALAKSKPREASTWPILISLFHQNLPGYPWGTCVVQSVKRQTLDSNSSHSLRVVRSNLHRAQHWAWSLLRILPLPLPLIPHLCPGTLSKTTTPPKLPGYPNGKMAVSFFGTHFFFFFLTLHCIYCTSIKIFN